MLILIEKDASTKVSREVAGIEEARAVAQMGMHVQIVNADGSYTQLHEYVDPDAEPPVESSAAAPAKKVAAKKVAAKKVAAKKSKR